MSGTGYFVNTPAGYQDLIQIFQAYSGSQAPTTGFTISTGKDLNQIFERLPINGTSIKYNTNMISLTGQDLAQVFSPILPSVTITAPDNKYYTYTSGDYTVVIFADYTSQTTNPPAVPTSNIGYNSVTGITVSFNNFINNTVYVTAVGGGGGGGNGQTYTESILSRKSKTRRGGGGGGGGGVSTVPLTPTTVKYSINVGGGGVAQNAGSSSSMDITGTRESVVISLGGNQGIDTAPGASGQGGTGGKNNAGVTGCMGGNGGTLKEDGAKFYGDQGTPGINSASFPIYPDKSYDFGGGGGGGYAPIPYPVGTVPLYPAGGLGGGGSTSAGTNGNTGLLYEGPNSIYYAVGGVLKNGYPGVGGGGSGGNASSGDQTGGQGGSGVVILCYKTVNPI
jgi:hypothetical protein